MFLVSARLSSSLPSSFLLYIIVLYYNTVHFYSQKLCTLEKFSKHITFFSLSFGCFFCCCAYSFFSVLFASLARQSNPLNRSGDLWYFSDGLFHIIDFNVILNYRKKRFFFPSLRFCRDTIKSREIPFMCPYWLGL